MLAALRRIAERNVAEVERLVRSYFDDRDPLEPVSREELLRRSHAGAVTVLDLRPEDEFALGHLPGAVNIPLRALEARLSELDPTQEVVAYCLWPYCVLSYEAGMLSIFSPCVLPILPIVLGTAASEQRLGPVSVRYRAFRILRHHWVIRGDHRFFDRTHRRRSSLCRCRADRRNRRRSHASALCSPACRCRRSNRKLGR
jgi:rhodanese-related sulfurtransferase